MHLQKPPPHHCTSIRADYGYGPRIDIPALKRGESIVVTTGKLNAVAVPVVVRSFSDLRALNVGYCDYKDLTVSWIADEDWPESWTCPECGGTEFEGVHRDYRKAGFEGSAFTVDTVEIDPPDDDP